MLKRIPSFIKNKYFLSGTFLLVWLCFFDRYDLLSQINLKRQLSKLKTDRDYFKNEITKNQAEIISLETDSVNLEKFAREHYLMKKKGEDIFVIIQKTDTSNKQQ